MYRLRELHRKMFRLIVFFFLPCVSVFLRLQHRLALICWNRGLVQDFFVAQFLDWELQLLPKCQWCPGNNHHMCILWNFSYFVHDHRHPREWVENRSQNHVTPIFNFICKKLYYGKQWSLIRFRWQKADFFFFQWNKSFIEKR